jgi:hypothetical protein
MQAEYQAAPIGPLFGLVETDGRYGRYFRLVAGKALGNMRIWPSRTGTGFAVEGGNRLSDAEAMAAIEIEIARHNEHVMAQSTADGAARPAPQTVRMLDFIAAREARPSQTR